MNRKDFLKKLGIGLAVVAVTPKIVAEIEKEKSIEKLETVTFKPKSISSHITVSDEFMDEFSQELIYTKASIEAEFLLRKAINNEIWFIR